MVITGRICEQLDKGRDTQAVKFSCTRQWQGAWRFTTDITTDDRKECARTAQKMAVEYQLKNVAVSQICN